MLQAGQAGFFHLHVDVIGQVGGRGTGARAVDEAEAHVEVDLFDEFHGCLEILIRLVREADDEVGTDGDVGTGGAQATDLGLVLQHGVRALHHGKNAVGAALHRQVKEADHFRGVLVDLDDVVGELDGVTGGVANAVDAVDGGHQPQKLGEGADATVEGRAPVGVDVLAEQVYFAYALLGELGDLIEHVVQRSAYLLAAGVGHHAEGAVFGTAFHDGNEGGRPFGARLGQAVKLLDFGEGDVNLGAAPFLYLLDHGGQAMQGLRAEHDVHIGGTSADVVPLLGGDAAAHADHQTGFVCLELFPATQLVKHLLLRFFADGAGVEQQNVCLFGLFGKRVAIAGIQQVGHFGRVVLVHLATPGFNVKFFAHCFS